MQQQQQPEVRYEDIDRPPFTPPAMTGGYNSGLDFHIDTTPSIGAVFGYDEYETSWERFLREKREEEGLTQ